MSSNKTTAIAVIPARGGSKRIPNKNIRDFFGKPIIAYSIAAAKNSKLFDRILVSTDSDEIAEVARSCGADVPFLRPKELADDFTGTAPVILHVLQWLQENEAKSYDFVCCIQATAPLLEVSSLRRAYETVAAGEADSAISVARYSYPILRSLKLNQDGHLEMNWPENYSKRSQDLPDAFHDAGQFYWARTETLMRDKKFLGPKTKPIVLPADSVQDIDNLEDWKAAERLFEMKQRKSD